MFPPGEDGHSPRRGKEQSSDVARAYVLAEPRVGSCVELFAQNIRSGELQCEHGLSMSPETGQTNSLRVPLAPPIGKRIPVGVRYRIAEIGLTRTRMLGTCTTELRVSEGDFREARTRPVFAN